MKGVALRARMSAWAMEVLGTNRIQIIEKSAAIIFLGENTALKVWSPQGAAEARLQYDWVTRAGGLAPVSLLRSEAGLLGLLMPRLSLERNLAHRIHTCTCDDLAEHLDDVCRVAYSAAYPPTISRPTNEVRLSLHTNLDAQISKLHSVGLPGWAVGLVQLGHSALSTCTFGSGDQVAVETHGNAFATNLWMTNTGWVALDRSQHAQERLVPSSAVHMSAVADYLLLHRGSPIDVRDVLSIAGRDGTHAELLMAVLIVKLLVRYRFTAMESGLVDDTGNERSKDVAAQKRMPILAKTILNGLAS